jgi:maltose O-acetyltransferase
MKLSGRNIPISKLLFLCLYYGFARYLPRSYSRWGIFGKKIRYAICKHIFKYCGCGANIERMACFGSGLDIELGCDSDLGINCNVPSNTIIGEHVMMAPNCYILACNHDFSRTDIPMNKQGYLPKQQTIIEDDCWIGRNVLMTPGRTIKRGTIIAAGCVLSKNFPEYSIVGGNPSRLIKSRIV